MVSSYVYENIYFASLRDPLKHSSTMVKFAKIIEKQAISDLEAKGLKRMISVLFELIQ